MDTTKIAERIFTWWYQLLKSSGYDSRIGVDPLRVDTKIGIQQQEGVVYFKFIPRHYFFGFDFREGSAVFYTFIPEIDFQIKPETREEFCGELEKTLNAPLKEFLGTHKGFTKFFTLPIDVGFVTRDFREEEYTGVSIGVKTNPMCFSKTRDRMRNRALEYWKKNVFNPTSKFFEENANKYLLNKN